MHRGLEDIKSLLSVLITNLEAKALEDNVISPDEKALLESVRWDIENLDTQLLEMLGSNLGDKEFKDLATQVLQDMLENALRVAKSDGKITEDERGLIDIIEKFSSQEESL